jgi:hypothetical protein
MLLQDTIRFTLNLEDRHNKLQQILSPNQEDEGVWYTKILGFICTFEKGFETTYVTKKQGHVYACIKR